MTEPQRPKSLIGIVQSEALADLPPAKVERVIESLRRGLLSEPDADDLLAKLANGEAVPDVVTELASKIQHGARARRRQANKDGQPPAPPRT